MAEKVVSVRLRALIDTYEKNMKKAGETTEKVAKADRWKAMGQATASLGDSLTSRLTVPIVGVGIAAIKMAGDVDAVFTQMQSLAGVAGSEIAGMKDAVLDLAGETGKAPKELSEALYFLRSSGLEASDAMDALEMSAKASAAGMGSTVDIADAVSSAMNAYAKSGLSAAEATDVLVATAREGKAEPAELAKQMGRLLPLSSELGISFQDVGAGLAALSLSGNDAAGASTLLTNIMSKLLKPSQQATEALAAVGISVDDIKTMLSPDEKGLLGTLETLRASLGDSGFAQFLEDAQAVQGGLALTGENVEKNREIFDSLSDSVGATDEAFAKWGKSIGAQNAQAWGEMQAAMVRLGDVLAPLAADFMSFGADIIKWFTGLPGPVQKAIGVFIAFAAAAGPVLSTVGRIQQLAGSSMNLATKFMDWASGMNSFGDAMNSGGRSADGLSTKLGTLARVAGNMAVAAGATMAMSAAMDKLFPVKETNLSKVENDLVRFAESGKLSGDAAELLGDEFEHLRTATADVFDASNVEKADNFVKWVSSVGGSLQDLDLEKADRLFSDLDETLTSLAAKDPDAAAQLFERISEEMKEAGASTDEIKGKFDGYAAVLADADTANRITADTVEETAGAFDLETTAITDAVDALSAYSDALTAQFDPLFGMLDAHKGVRDARLAVEEATRKLAEAEKEHGKDSAEAAEASRDLADAHDDAVTSALGYEQAQIALASAVEDGSVKLDEAEDMLQRWVEAGHITQAEADGIAAKFRVAAGSVENYRGTVQGAQSQGNVRTNIEHNAVAAREAVDMVRRRFEALDGRVYSVRFKTIYETEQHGARGGPGFRLHEGGYVPGRRGQEIAGLLLGGEEVLHWDDPRHSSNLTDQRFMGQYTPQEAFMGGGGVTIINQTISLKGAIISSSFEAERWVATAFNNAAARSLVTVRGRPL
jgi:TP901 family phage tail tape measure protein